MNHLISHQDLMALEAELAQLRAVNNQLRKWNKDLNEALQKALLPKETGGQLPPEATI